MLTCTQDIGNLGLFVQSVVGMEKNPAAAVRSSGDGAVSVSVVTRGVPPGVAGEERRVVRGSLRARRGL